MSATCDAFDVEEVAALSTRIIQEVFTAWVLQTNATHITYSIDSTIRSHAAPLSRDHLIRVLGEAVATLAAASAATNHAFTCSADLANADLVLLPQAFQKCYGLSIVQGKLFNGKQGRKFNLDMIAVEARKEQAEREGTTHVRGAELGDGAGVELPQPQDTVMQ